MKKHVKELTEGMQRLCAVANRIVAQQDKPSRIEVDLLLADLRNLYDIALQLGDDAVPEEPRPAPVEAPSTVELAETPVKEEEHMMAMMSTMAALAPEPVEEPAPSPAVDVKPQPIEPQEPEPPVAAEPEPPVVAAPEMPAMEELEQNDNALLFDEVIMEPEPVASEPEPEVSMPEPEPAVKPSQQASLMDFLNQPVATVGEQPNNTQRTLGTPQRTLGESLGADRPQPTNLEKKVDDLRSVININDKFCFMSELFHNNMKAYNDFIMSLNAIADRDEALAYVQEAATQQKWDDASSTVKAFYKIFDKKF